MKKYANKNVANKLMIGGGILIAISIAVTYISIFSLYGKAGEDMNANSGFSLQTDQLLITIASFVRYAGIVALLGGIILYSIIRSLEK